MSVVFGTDGSMMSPMGNMDVKLTKDGSTIYNQSGSMLFGSDGSVGSMSGNMFHQTRGFESRIVNRMGSGWVDSCGRSYWLTGSILSCSDGRMWSGIHGVEDAEQVVRRDF